MTVSVIDPRHDSRGKWLCGTIIQRLGPATYLVRVGGGTRYVHIDQLRTRDGRSFTENMPEQLVVPVSIIAKIPNSASERNKHQDKMQEQRPVQRRMSSRVSQYVVNRTRHQKSHHHHHHHRVVHKAG